MKRKVVTFLTAATLTATLLPTAVFAEELTESSETVQETQAPVETVSTPVETAEQAAPASAPAATAEQEKSALAAAAEQGTPVSAAAAEQETPGSATEQEAPSLAAGTEQDSSTSETSTESEAMPILLMAAADDTSSASADYGAMAEYTNHRYVFDLDTKEIDAAWSFCLNSDRHAPTNDSHGEYIKLENVTQETLLANDVYFQYGITQEQFTKITRIMNAYIDAGAPSGSAGDNLYFGAQRVIWYVLNGTSPYNMTDAQYVSFVTASEDASKDTEIANSMTVSVYKEVNDAYQNLITAVKKSLNGEENSEEDEAEKTSGENEKKDDEVTTEESKESDTIDGKKDTESEETVKTSEKHSVKVTKTSTATTVQTVSKNTATAATAAEAVKTGDQAEVLSWIVMTLSAWMAMTALLSLRMRRRQ